MADLPLEAARATTAFAVLPPTLSPTTHTCPSQQQESTHLVCPAGQHFAGLVEHLELTAPHGVLGVACAKKSLLAPSRLLWPVRSSSWGSQGHHPSHMDRQVKRAESRVSENDMRWWIGELARWMRKPVSTRALKERLPMLRHALHHASSASSPEGYMHSSTHQGASKRVWVLLVVGECSQGYPNATTRPYSREREVGAVEVETSKFQDERRTCPSGRNHMATEMQQGPYLNLSCPTGRECCCHTYPLATRESSGERLHCAR